MLRTKLISFIKPINILLDITAISFLGAFYLSPFFKNGLLFWLYEVVLWASISYFSTYYKVYRFTGLANIAIKILKQFIFYTIAISAYFIFSHHTLFNTSVLLYYMALVLLISTGLKMGFYLFLKSIPIQPAGAAILIGHNTLPYTAQKEVIQQFENKNYTIQNAVAYARQNAVNTIYCSLTSATPSQNEILATYCEQSGAVLRFIPNTKENAFKGMYIDYFKDFPALVAQKTPLYNPVSKLFKRCFDITFSLFIVIFVLSWLVPLLGLLIKLESKGPVFFKQNRPGVNETEFYCLKFRSMAVNQTSESMATKNDARVTKIGKFIRKTSLDEMPQFINVLKGDMSIVGPRPQLWSQNNSFKKHINKYSNRLLVKPGITGLAQVSGYRGEINSHAEMQNRVRYDVFYIENWSILLDIRIIIQTVVNIFMGEEKAY